jgi:hypothetical protein
MNMVALLGTSNAGEACTQPLNAPQRARGRTLPTPYQSSGYSFRVLQKRIMHPQLIPSTFHTQRRRNITNALCVQCWVPERLPKMSAKSGRCCPKQKLCRYARYRKSAQSVNLPFAADTTLQLRYRFWSDVEFSMPPVIFVYDDSGYCLYP